MVSATKGSIANGSDAFCNADVFSIVYQALIEKLCYEISTGKNTSVKII